MHSLCISYDQEQIAQRLHLSVAIVVAEPN